MFFIAYINNGCEQICEDIAPKMERRIQSNSGWGGAGISHNTLDAVGVCECV